jgi:hypothetical protein
MMMSFTLGWLEEKMSLCLAFFVLAVLFGSAVFTAFRARGLARATS